MCCIAQEFALSNLISSKKKTDDCLIKFSDSRNFFLSLFCNAISFRYSLLLKKNNLFGRDLLKMIELHFLFYLNYYLQGLHQESCWSRPNRARHFFMLEPKRKKAKKEMTYKYILVDRVAQNVLENVLLVAGSSFCWRLQNWIQYHKWKEKKKKMISITVRNDN